MPPRSPAFPVQHARSIGAAALLVAGLGCAQVLGVPSDPDLVGASPRERAPWPPFDPAPFAEPRDSSGSVASSMSDDGRGVRSDGVLPPDEVAGIDDTLEADRSPPGASQPESADAGSVDAGGPAPAGC